jgi:hypothetical protein
MKPEYYSKRAIAVEVLQFVYTDECVIAMKEFLGDNMGYVSKARHPGAVAEMQIKTLEDGIHFKVKHIATEGDYIIKGHHNDCWAVKEHIFLDTYEKL